MIIRVKCPWCGHKLKFKCSSENRRKAKGEKLDHIIVMSLLGECRLIHNGELWNK